MIKIEKQRQLICSSAKKLTTLSANPLDFSFRASRGHCGVFQMRGFYNEFCAVSQKSRFERFKYRAFYNGFGAVVQISRSAVHSDLTL